MAPNLPAQFRAVIQRNIDDLRNPSFYRAVFAELLGTLILVFVGCAVCMDNWQTTAATRQSTTVQISLTFGIAVATAVWCIAHVSGGHINPAVTVAMLITRKITIVRAALYVVAQCAGAIAGAGLLYGLHPVDQLTLGNTEVQEPLTDAQAYGIEAVITFVLVFTVFASCDKGRTDLGGSIPLTIGLSVALCHFFAIKYTGSSMNPARSLGPAVVAGRWSKHWVYWTGPISGGIVAGLLYELVFSVDSSISKLKGLVSPGGYESYELAPVHDKGAEGEADRFRQSAEKA